MSKYDTKCPCIDLVRCSKCAEQICREIHEANIHYCVPVKEKGKDYVCSKCTSEVLNEN